MIKKKVILFCLVAIILFGFASSVFALDWPQAPGPGQLKLDPQTSTLTELIAYLYQWAIVLGGLAAFVMLLAAGFQYLTSTGDPTKTKDARDRIGSAIGGLVLLLASFLILNTLNPELTALKPPQLPSKQEIDCKKPENQNKDECKEQAASFYSGNCTTVKAYSQKNYKNLVGTAVVAEKGDGTYSSSPTSLKQSINKGSLQILYTDRDGKEKDGGFCNVVFYQNKNCNEGDKAIGSFIFSVKNMGIYIDNNPPINCMIATGEGQETKTNP